MDLGSRNDWLGVRQTSVGVVDAAGEADEAIDEAFDGNFLRRLRRIQVAVIIRILVRTRAVTTPAMIGSSVTKLDMVRSA